jgi:hypothetical protein
LYGFEGILVSIQFGKGIFVSIPAYQFKYLGEKRNKTFCQLNLNKNEKVL